MSDSNTPVTPVPDNNIISPSLMNISQEAMLEIIGMQPVKKVESNAPKEEDTDPIAADAKISESEETNADVKEETQIFETGGKTSNNEKEKERCSTPVKKKISTTVNTISTTEKSNTFIEEETKLSEVLSKNEKEKVRSSTPAKEETHLAETATKQCKELKSILQLAKEARLDTNIGHKRKSMVSERLEQSGESSDEKDHDTARKDVENIKHFFKIKLSESRSKSMIEFDCATCIAAKGKIKKAKSDSDKQAVTAQKKDSFCWRCHKTHTNISCEVCPRSYHKKCVKQFIPTTLENWLCPECTLTLTAENTTTRSATMKEMTVEHLNGLLKFALKRMLKCNSTEPFQSPVNEREFPDYKRYIVQPMDLMHLEKHIKDNIYGSTQAFEADAKWILHNSIIYNGYQSKLTTAAKAIIKVCKQEMREIENCSTCYLNANIKKNSWFVEVCPKPHILLWAKLKSFPYWPAKAMATNSQGMVDARFFGAHDRAWVPIKDCYLFSRKDPNSNNIQKNNINDCIKELEVHVAKLKEIYGEFNYAPYKTPFDPELEIEQLKIFLPKYKPNGLQKITDKPNICDKPESTETTTGSIGSTSSSSSKQKKRARSRSRHRKSTSEDKDMEGYGTDDDFETSLNNERRKQLLKTFENDGKDCEKVKGDENDVQMNRLENESRSDDGKDKGENRLGMDQNPSNAKDRLTQDISEPSSKRLKRASEQTIKNDSSRSSSISEKISKVNIDETMEITLGNTSTSASGSDSSINETVNCIVKTKNAVQVNVENKELNISPQNKTKISDKIIRILNNSDEATTSSTDKRGAMTQTDLLLKEYSQHKESSTVPDVKVTANKTTRENFLEDTQVDEANINSMILNRNSTEKDFRKGKKRSISSVETNTESSQSKTLKLTNQLELRHNVLINESDDFGNKDAHSMNETDPLALVEIKTEPCSDEENIGENRSTKAVTEARCESSPAKAVDNLTEVINAVASGAIISKPKIPKSYPSKKSQESIKKTNKARKSFPTIVAKTFDNLISPHSTLQIQPTVSSAAPPLVTIGLNKEPIETTVSASCNLPTKTITTANIELNESQNYIPLVQNPSYFSKSGEVPQVSTTTISTNPSTSSNAANANGPATSACLSSIMEEFSTFKDSLPEAAAKAVSDLICKPPPKLKPRPPSALSDGFEECIPSSAGTVTSKLNSVAYRMTDYFRGLVTETLRDLSSDMGDNAATVALLKSEIEQLKHRHSLEILEIKKNVYSILKDIQKSIVEEQKRIVEETRAACEAETIKRVLEAKSKQWCAYCNREAQFYCCWNTSYCNYACQQKHWPKHVTKCTQNVTNQISTAKPAQVQPLLLRPAAPPKNMSVRPLLPKTTKVVFNAKPGNITNQIAQIMKSTSAGHIRLVESAPGNYEILGDGSVKVGGKVLSNTSLTGKFKSGNIITVTSSSTPTLIVSSSAQNSGNSVTANTAKPFDLPTISNVMSLANHGM